MNKTKLLLLVIILTTGLNLTAQVGINSDGSLPDGSAILDVKSTEKGVLFPRMTQAERNTINEPVAGLVVFCSDCLELQLYNGTEWVNINGSPATIANEAPLVSDVNFSGTLEVGYTLTGSYTYIDTESDLEGVSIFQWYRADDGSGTNQTAISGASTLTYDLVAADDNKYISFEVVPVALTGTSTGIPVMSAYQGAIYTNLAPLASNVTFTGTLEVGNTLTATYDYSDVESDLEGISTYLWFRADDISGTNWDTINGETALIYELVAADDGTFIAFEVTPLAQSGTSPGNPVMSAYQGAVYTNQAPLASNVTFTGTLEVGQTLTATYDYSDAESDLEGTSTFLWFRSDDISGTNWDTINGETALIYELVAADDGKFIAFEVVPVALTGSSPGLAVLSTYQGPVVMSASFSCGDALIDARDSQSYITVQIGTQCWMAENLNIGTMINSGTTQIDNSIFEKYCYDNSTSNCDTYGGLYQWNEAMQYVTTEGTQGTCPTGWHLPTDAEWCTLENEVDAGTVSCSTTALRGTDAGGNLKESGTSHWNSPNTGATNSSGFASLPGGILTSGSFYNLTYNAYFWSSSDNGSGVWRRYLYNDYAQVARDSYNKTAGFSVRCMQD